MTVYCYTCEHCLREGANPWQWLCMKHRRAHESGHGYVLDITWDKAPPYHRCVEMNPSGTCPLFERKRDQQMEMIK